VGFTGWANRVFRVPNKPKRKEGKEAYTFSLVKAASLLGVRGEQS
jgi:hypothetical protein